MFCRTRGRRGVGRYFASVERQKRRSRSAGRRKGVQKRQCGNIDCGKDEQIAPCAARRGAGIKLEGDQACERGNGRAEAAKAKAKKKPERAPDAQMDGEKPMAP